MIIKVYSEEAMKSYTCDVPHITISVRSPGRLDKPFELPLNLWRKGSLRLQFHDLDDQVEDSGIIDLFEPGHAQKLVEFVKRYEKEVQTILINCEAGISRSAGIAAALSKFYNGDDSFYFKSYLPNRRVYRIILEELHTPMTELKNYRSYNPDGSRRRKYPKFI